MKHSKVELLKFMKYFGVTLIGIIGVALFVLVYAEYRTIDTSREWVSMEEESIIQAEISILNDELGRVIVDLNYLKSIADQLGMDNKGIEDIKKQWLLFASNKYFYDQIRFIDQSGMEKIRINLTDAGSQCVPAEELQYKGDRYYYKKAALLENGSIYISPFDLNVEGGKVELPRKPVIRFGTPVYNEDGVFQGVVIVNYLGKYVLERFEALLQYSKGNLYLVNDNGYYLYSGEPHKDFAFMFEHQQMNTFAADYPKVWEEVKLNHQTYLSDKGYFYIQTVVLDDGQLREGRDEKNSKENRWYVVSHIPSTSQHYYFVEPNLRLIINKVMSEYLIFLLLLSVLSFVIAMLLFQNKTSFNRIRYLSEYDEMTGILNRRAGLSNLRELLQTYDGQSGKMFLCYLDVDGLKQVNDQLGHDVGDELLMIFVGAVKEMIRDSDLFIRLGGDEFLLVLHHMDKDVHRVIWKRIENEMTRINKEEGKPYIVSVSKGFLEVTANNVDEMDMLMKKVDQLMYLDKQQKPNRQVIK